MCNIPRPSPKGDKFFCGKATTNRCPQFLVNTVEHLKRVATDIPQSYLVSFLVGRKSSESNIGTRTRNRLPALNGPKTKLVILKKLLAMSIGFCQTYPIEDGKLIVLIAVKGFGAKTKMFVKEAK